eukprot:TRINITY_DN1355_c0_g1_i1.p1 TRINITY_DN1355_c0_g1~~TRINITY_DN1355_c0_g1_i1.p1  ORF type:complete len:156 (-),score=16.84 TRINITY_DN1355_c0_g1_i1:295-762(-)
MATPMLKRSAISFRRQGSSGLAWSENWIPAETDGKGPPVSVSLAPASSTATVPEEQPKESEPVAVSQVSSSSEKIPSRLRHSRSVGLIGAGYVRNRDPRVGSAEFAEAVPASSSPVKDASALESSKVSHKSHWNLMKWFKRKFGKGKKHATASGS